MVHKTQFGCEDIAGCNRLARLFVFTMLTLAGSPLMFADAAAGQGGGDSYTGIADGELGALESEPVKADSFEAAEEGLQSDFDNAGINEHVTEITDVNTGETREFNANTE